MTRFAWAFALALATGACGRTTSGESPVLDAESSSSTSSSAPTVSPTVSPSVDAAIPATMESSRGEAGVAASAGAPAAPDAAASASLRGTASPPPASASLSVDGSTSSCRAIRGPIELPLRVPAALSSRADGIDVVLDDNGRPHLTSFAAGPVAPSSPAPAKEPVEGPAAEARTPRVPCAVVADFALCPDRTGAVHRAPLAGDGDRIIASSRVGSRVAAAVLAGGHTALAYLASRKTTEGWVSEAWLAVDDDVPVRLSEDGSGATAVDLAPRGSSLLALIIDSRTALTAMHARPVGYDHGARLAEDEVVFVGGPGDRFTAAALAIPRTGPSWALLPIAKDTLDFGLAVVRLDDPPRVDEPVVWSMYPNGLDPASVAAVATANRMWVARVRPGAAAPGSAHVLELGDLASDGAFAPHAVIPTGDAPSDVSLAADSRGALWVAWLDASGSWLERLACR